MCCINKYRLTLPRNIQNYKIIVLVDNHQSSCNNYAIVFLARNNIDLLTFPPHKITNSLIPNRQSIELQILEHV